MFLARQHLFSCKILPRILIEQTDQYTMGQKDRKSKKTHSLFVDELKIYQESPQKLEVLHGMIMKASIDIGVCYEVKK